MAEYDINIIRSRYSLVPRTLVFIQRGEKILFLRKENKSSYGFGKLNGLGGHIEKGEEPFEAAEREICEESQIEVSNLELAAILTIDINTNPGIMVFVFRAVYESGEPRKSNEGDLIWLSREDISKDITLIKDVPYLVNLCDSYQTGTPPKMVKYLYNDMGDLRIVN